jgi:hypothetical protein
LINTLIKIARYKIHLQKPAVFLYSNEHAEKETIPFTISSKKEKKLGIKLRLKELYSEILKHQRKKLKKKLKDG